MCRGQQHLTGFEDVRQPFQVNDLVAGEGVGHFADSLLEALHGLFVVDFESAGVVLAEVGRGDLEGSIQPPAVCMSVTLVMTESQNLQVASLMARKAVRSPVA